MPNMKYLTKKCSLLGSNEIKKCSELFSKNYGFYSANSPVRPGERIKLGEKYYEKLRDLNNTYVSLAYCGDELVGQAFYVLEKTSSGYLSWVIQLVVREDYRRRSIAKKLLLSVWGFSNDRAWGLATTNPLTVKTLESATFRKVSFIEMKKNIETIKEIGSKVSFIDEETIDIIDNNATVDTKFYVDHGTIQENITAYGDGWQYGDLDEGKEWVAFVFQDQEIVAMSPEKLEKLLEESESCLVDAYSRMQIHEHSWAKGTRNEIDFIMNYFSSKEKLIIDFGCGTGRHLFELKRRGYTNLFGIDFSKNHIQYCKDKHPECASFFEVKDCRYYSSDIKYDYALCLYDVIGSFSRSVDNLKILERLHHSLRDRGVAIISVMNMEMTKHVATNIINIYKNPQSLFKLKASNIMQSTGDIFDPEYFIIDTHTGNVFRKEKFTNDGGLSSEYIVRDKRYTKEEIEEMANKVGFDIVESRYVRAGNWEESRSNIDTKAKEILLVLRKKA